MKVAYIRVSTEDQNTARQEEAMESQGIEKAFFMNQSENNACQQCQKNQLYHSVPP